MRESFQMVFSAMCYTFHDLVDAFRLVLGYNEGYRCIPIKILGEEE